MYSNEHHTDSVWGERASFTGHELGDMKRPEKMYMYHHHCTGDHRTPTHVLVENVRWPGSRRNARREEVVLAIIRLGHTYLTHSYLLNREDQPECVG